MKEVKLSAGKESFSEIKKYLESNKNLNYSLSIYDEIKQSTAEIMCSFDEFISVIILVSTIEHDFPNWIGINELTDSYVIGMNFTRGTINTPAIYEYKSGKLIEKRD